MSRNITTEEAAHLLGTTPTALRAALSRDPNAPHPTGLDGHSNAWDLDQLITWDQERTRRTGRVDADRGRPMGAFALHDGDTTGIVTGWWSGATLRLDITTLPDSGKITGAATVDGVEDADTARQVTTALSRVLTGVSEIGGPADPLVLDDPALAMMVDQIGAVLTQAIRDHVEEAAHEMGERKEAADTAAREQERAEEGRRVGRLETRFRHTSEMLGGDFGPWVRTTVLSVSRTQDWALGDVQRALEVAFPGDETAQRAAFLNVIWARERRETWPGVERAETLLD